MKKNHIAIIFIVLLLFIIIMLVYESRTDLANPESAEPDEEKTLESRVQVSIAAEEVEGDYYAVGTGISTIINKRVEDIEASCTPAGTALENLEDVDSGRVDMTLATAYLGQLAYHGEEHFDQPLSNLRVIAALYSQTAQFVVVKKSGLELIQELSDKKVSVGLPNSETRVMAELFLEIHDISFAEIEQEYLDSYQAFEALKEGEIDCMFVNATVPGNAVATASAVLDINLLEINERLVDRFSEDISYIKTETLLPRTYKGISKYLQAGSVPVLLMVNKDLDDEVAYWITRGIFENLDEISSMHKLEPELLSSDLLMNLDIPIHPGATWYYAEKDIF